MRNFARSIDADLAALSPGTLAGGYRIAALLSAGRHTLTYRARDPDGRHAILKEYAPAGLATRDGTVLRPTHSDFGAGLARFRDDAAALHGLGRVPGLVPVRAAFEDHGTAYLAMPVVDGSSLAGLIAAHGALPAEGVESLVQRLAAALARAHAAGVVHGAIDPTHVLIDDGGEPTLIGFGSAALAAPDPAADIRGLAAVALTALHGAPPEDPAGHGPVAYAARLEAALAAGSARDAAQRPASMAAWLAMLTAGAPAPAPRRLSPNPPSPLPLSPRQEAPRPEPDDTPGETPARPRRPLLRGVAVAAVVGGLVLGLGIREALQEATPRPAVAAAPVMAIGRADETILLAQAAVERMTATVGDAAARGLDPDRRQRLDTLIARSRTYLARQREARARLAADPSPARREELLIALDDLSAAIRENEAAAQAIVSQATYPSSPVPAAGADATVAQNAPTDLLPPIREPAYRPPYRPPYPPPPADAAAPSDVPVATPVAPPRATPLPLPPPSPADRVASALADGRAAVAAIDRLYRAAPEPESDTEADRLDRLADIRDRAHARLEWANGLDGRGSRAALREADEIRAALAGDLAAARAVMGRD